MSYDVAKDLERVLFTEENLDEKISEIAKELNDYYGDKEVIIVAILKGSIPFYWDLIKKLTFPVKFDFMAASSYGDDSESSGVVRVDKDLFSDIKGENVLIIEDILDSGNTLSKLKKMLLSREPKDLKLCCLLDKPARRKQNIEADFSGFEIDDFFVVGYGLDYAGKYRQLPYIGILSPSVYNK